MEVWHQRLRLNRLGITSRLYEVRICLDLAHTLTPGLPSPGFTYPPASPVNYPPATRSVRFPKETAPTLRLLDLARARQYWNINQLCIDYALRPRLSSRLTLGGLAFPRNPWAFGGGVSHPSLATHACILTRYRSTGPSRAGFTAASTLLYHSYIRTNP